MIRLLANLSPVLVLLVGAVPAFAAGWFAHGVKFDWVDRPAITREAAAAADSACAIRTMDAANRAEQAARARHSAANAEAMRMYREALDASQRTALAAESQLEKEISDHETELGAAGRSCVLTDADIDWLYERGAPGAN